MSFINDRLTVTTQVESGVGPRRVISGNRVAENSQTEGDASADVLTFSGRIFSVEIYHSEATAQEFVINGLTLSVAGGGWRSEIGGVPGFTVTLPTGVTGIIVTRLE